MEPRARIAEIFRSFQGEGLLLGKRQVFVRLAGCTIDCRYCDTAWAFDVPARVARPRPPAEPGGNRAQGRGESADAPGQHVDNPLALDDVLELVACADPAPHAHGPAPVSITGGEPLEQAEFSAALARRLGAAGRDVMLETAGLDADALARVVEHVRWVACDIKLPSATGLADVLERHEAVLATGVLADRDVFFKLVADGDTGADEVQRAAELLARHAPRAPVFLQPVSPLGGSPRLPREDFDRLVDVLAEHGLDVRVVPQVHKLLGVR